MSMAEGREMLQCWSIKGSAVSPSWGGPGRVSELRSPLLLEHCRRSWSFPALQLPVDVSGFSETLRDVLGAPKPQIPVLSQGMELLSATGVP